MLDREHKENKSNFKITATSLDNGSKRGDASKFNFKGGTLITLDLHPALGSCNEEQAIRTTDTHGFVASSHLRIETTCIIRISAGFKMMPRIGNGLRLRNQNSL